MLLCICAQECTRSAFRIALSLTFTLRSKLRSSLFAVLLVQYFFDSKSILLNFVIAVALFVFFCGIYSIVAAIGKTLHMSECMFVWLGKQRCSFFNMALRVWHSDMYVYICIIISHSIANMNFYLISLPKNISNINPTFTIYILTFVTSEYIRSYGSLLASAHLSVGAACAAALPPN